jgi:glycerol uptake facilitator-like aquaporin
MIHQPIPTHTLASGIGYTQGVVWEIVLTFSLLFTVYATMVDPKKGALSGLGPLLIGFVVGANIMEIFFCDPPGIFYTRLTDEMALARLRG